jgi:hypothetical protein
MVYTITSCCVNDNKYAWIVYNNGDIFAISDITNANQVWENIPSVSNNKVVQLSSSTYSNSKLLLAVTENGGLYYTYYDNVKSSSDWKKINVEPVKYACINNDGNCHVITNNDVVKFSNGTVNMNPLFNITMKTPPGKPKFIRYTSDGWAALTCTDSPGTITYITSKGRSTDPSWSPRLTAYMNHLAFAQKDGHLMGIFGSNLLYKTRWDNGNTVGTISAPSNNIAWNNCSFTSGDLFIATTNKDGGEVAYGYIKSISGYNNNGLINPTYYGKKYYGNTIPVKREPYKITLTGQIPIRSGGWRDGTEYRYNGCGFSSGCDYNDNDRRAARKPYNDTGYPIELNRNSLMDWQGYKYGGGCAAGQYKGRCWVPPDFLTHVFGYGTSNTIPASGSQYGNRDSKPSIPSALDLQITPFDKKTNNPYGDNAKWSSIDPSQIDPTFSSISFNLPDPTEEIDIDSVIPYILLMYAEPDYGRGKPGVTQPGPVIDMNRVNDYISKYFFTNVNGNPRISFISNTGLSSDQKNMYKYLQPILTKWKTLPINSYQPSAQNYCSNKNLTTAWCQNVCKTADAQLAIDCDNNLKTFCSSGGYGKLPDYVNNGILPSKRVTQKILDDAYPYYTKYPEVCGCNMPTSYYQQLDIKSFQEIPSSIANDDLKQTIFNKIFLAGGVGGRANCNPLTNCRSGGNVLPNKGDIARGTCPTIAIQNCLQQASTTVGNVEGSSEVGTIKQSIECKQEINNLKSSTDNNTQGQKPTDISPGTKQPVKTPPATTPPAKTPPAKTPPATTPPVKTPPAKTPPAKTPPATTPPAKTPPAKKPPPSSNTALYVGGGITALVVVIMIVIMIMYFKKT